MMSVLAIAFLGGVVKAQDKKVKTFSLEKTLPFSADQIWKVVAEDYGKVADSHPRIIASEYTAGSLRGEEGAERICYFNDQKTQFLHEKIKDWNPQEMSYTNTIFQAGKFPVDPAYTIGKWQIIPVDENHSRVVFNMQFRTKPAMMAGMMKGSFTKLVQDYFVAIEHHLATGEKVTRDNFKEVKKLYAAR